MATANIIPLTSTTVKINFIGYDAPSVAGATTVTVDSTGYTVLEESPDNCSWLIIDASYSDFGTSRVEATVS
jgi:hypothetical protein